MARHGFGRGEYRYFAYPLPPLVEACATASTRARADRQPLARAMGMDVRFPAEHAAFLERCHAAGQTRPTPLLLRYGAGRLQLPAPGPVRRARLSAAGRHPAVEPGEDFDGGEFVLTEQRPRMQTRATVVPLRKGDAVVFAVNSGRCRARAATTA